MVLAVKPLNVAVVVLPFKVAPPGLAVTVQLLAGRLLRSTLPVATLQVGPLITLTTGADGVTGCVGITALADGAEVQPLESNVTVNVYVVPPGKFTKVAVVVLPLMLKPPGCAVIVQLLAGSPLKATLPVATAQVGEVMVPITGAVGTTGTAFITALPDAAEVQPLDSNVTVKV